MVPIATSDENIVMMKASSRELLQKANAKSEVVVLKSDNSIDAVSKASASYDLLILGTPQKDNWLSVLFGTGKDKFTEKSACSVLRLTMKDGESI